MSIGLTILFLVSGILLLFVKKKIKLLSKLLKCLNEYFDQEKGETLVAPIMFIIIVFYYFFFGFTFLFLLSSGTIVSSKSNPPPFETYKRTP